MNLTPLFEAQKKLDERIVKEKGLQGHDLLDKKILALQVELGELANEWRGFKFWSNNQKPVMVIKHLHPDTEKADFWRCGNEIDCGYKSETVMVMCDMCGWKSFPYEWRNPLLEEYVDCFHFILSIGNELELRITNPAFSSLVTHQTEKQFNLLFYNISKFWEGRGNKKTLYSSIFDDFLGLGEMLGFTWEQIEQAYFAKNKINHERQANGY